MIWASSATYHMSNIAFRLVDKMTKAWIDKYGQTLKDSIDSCKVNMDANDYRLGRATMSTSRGTRNISYWFALVSLITAAMASGVNAFS